MKVHKSGVINNGFVLNEKSLRRLRDTSREQLKKACDSKICEMFIVKYTNGVVEEFNEIDDVFELDNSGSSKICYLSLFSEVEDESHTIELSFADPSEVSGTDAIRYEITGEDRDWLFLTLSSIEDRIKPIERNKFWKVDFKPIDIMSFSLFGAMFGLAYFLISLNAIMPNLNKSDFNKTANDFITVEYNVLDKLKELSTQKPDLKPVEVFYEYQFILKERSRITEEAKYKYQDEYQKWRDKEMGARGINSTGLMFLHVFLPAFAVFVLLYVYKLFVNKFYPLYIFCWGYNKELFEKGEGIRKFMLGTVITGLLVSIAAGVILGLF